MFRAWSGGSFGEGDGLDIVLDDLQCNGDEGNLLECGHSGWGVSDCLHSQDAGVECHPPAAGTYTMVVCFWPLNMCDTKTSNAYQVL